MRLHEKNLDFTTLTWVKPELDETLRQARNALQNYVEEGESPAELRTCADLLHQVQGTLRMVELYGAAMVAEEMEQLARALIEAKVANRDNAYAVLMQGIVQLPDYWNACRAAIAISRSCCCRCSTSCANRAAKRASAKACCFRPTCRGRCRCRRQGPEKPLDPAELTRRAEACAACSRVRCCVGSRTTTVRRRFAT